LSAGCEGNRREKPHDAVRCLIAELHLENNAWISARKLREWCIRADHAGDDIWGIDHLP